LNFAPNLSDFSPEAPFRKPLLSFEMNGKVSAYVGFAPWAVSHGYTTSIDFGISKAASR
jgi:hypothetical protein